MAKSLIDLENDWYKRDRGFLISEGRIYVAFVANESVSNGDDLTVVLSVGDKPAAILTTNITVNGTLSDFAVYRSPTYTGGSSLPKLNLNDIIGVTGGENVDALNSSLVITDKGTPVFGPWDLYSSNNLTIIREINGPLILKPNTEYLIAMNNPQGSPIEMSLAITYVDH